eukprot:7489142-Pyramimonas_sp.AAC.1
MREDGLEQVAECGWSVRIVPPPPEAFGGLMASPKVLEVSGSHCRSREASGGFWRADASRMLKPPPSL